MKIMKKITLFATAVFFIGSSVKASESISFEATHYPVAIADAEPIVFRERGIEFFVFADGQFDFNTVPSRNESTTYYYKGRRNTVNTTYGAPGVDNYGGVRIEHDNQGRIRRIGNTFMNYDARGRIKRIGSVYMSYNRFALAQVGGLYIEYDRWGRIIGTSGRVNASSWNYHPQQNGGYYGGSYNSNEDEDYYYYKANGTKEKIENKPQGKK